MKTKFLLALMLAVALTVAAESAPRQVLIPTTAAEVPSPAPGTAMTKEYVHMVGRMAYLWGWDVETTSLQFQPIALGFRFRQTRLHR
jgi:hypothetical protein